MKKQNGFIATSLLYTFFLAFVTLFIGVVTLYLQNRVYLTKLEDSSKNSIYIREIKDKGLPKNVKINGDSSKTITNIEGSIFTISSKTCNVAKCELIYFNGSMYVLEGCEKSCV